ncbi:MAG: NERD domain-containing protein [Gammaproteobacteria bacterium]|nr:NERD domain-containing protein [Gammaproteobacteria bacterium]MDE0435618.1 NERD domain-containing protein [Bryobacterales bacterium]
MRMVPPVPFETGSQAEKRIFDRLRIALDDTVTAYHSLRPTRHPGKRFPEIDFVICSTDGIFVLEVKGGRVSCEGGIWRYRDRTGRVAESNEGPFRQAETALHGLAATIRTGLPPDICESFTMGYGVVFPDCEWRGRGVEWDEPMVADVRRSRDMGTWLRGLFAYWQGRDATTRRPERDSLRRLQNVLRPEATAHRPALIRQVEDTQQRIERLTEDQMRMADVADANPRALCYGGAGTGKTFLAEHLARRWAHSGMQVALVCRSPWLRHHLSSRLIVPGVTVSLADGVRLDCRRAGLAGFDALIVDEGQDLLDPVSIDVIDSVLDGGLGGGRWSWFQDVNQSFFPAGDPQAEQRLLDSKPVRMPLRTNCRNTHNILDCVQDLLGADLGVKGAGAGPEIRMHNVASASESAGTIASEIAELVDHGGLAPGSVTVLSPFDFDESSVSAVGSESPHEIRRLDEFSMRAVPRDTVGFARIDEFKGLENDAVIVADLPDPRHSRRDPVSHYVAMSRPRSVLSLVCLGAVAGGCEIVRDQAD